MTHIEFYVDDIQVELETEMYAEDFFRTVVDRESVDNGEVWIDGARVAVMSLY